MGNIVISIISRMSSPTVVEGSAEEAPLLQNNDNVSETETGTDIVREIDEFLKFHKKDEKEEPTTEQSKVATKRKKNAEDNISPNILTEVFLRIFYPISSCMSKSVSIGLMKSLDYSPTVILNHGSKMVLFSENAWDSFLKHMHLIECYLSKSLCGRRTNIRLLDCDNEIDIVKHRGQKQVRIRDLTQHDSKIMLTREEFYTLNYATSPITRYMKQLVFSLSVIKEYLEDTLDKQPESPILFGPVDTSIFNRIPHEVEMWRQLRNFEPTVETAEEVKEEDNVKEDDHVTSNESQPV